MTTLDMTEEVEAVEAVEADDEADELTDEMLFDFDDELPADEALFADEVDDFDEAPVVSPVMQHARVDVPSKVEPPSLLSLHRFRSFKA